MSYVHFSDLPLLVHFMFLTYADCRLPEMERRAEDGMDEPPHASASNPRTGGNSDNQVVPTLRLSIGHHGSRQVRRL